MHEGGACDSPSLLVVELVLSIYEVAPLSRLVNLCGQDMWQSTWLYVGAGWRLFAPPRVHRHVTKTFPCYYRGGGVA